MTTYNDTTPNVRYLAELLGFTELAARAWLRCEGQEIPNPTNPLNIRFYGRAGQSRGPGATGARGVGFAGYASAAAGLLDAVSTITRLAPRYGYGAILKAAGSADALAQARAIELSSWAAGHYGGTADRDGCLRRYVRANVVRQVSPAPRPAPAPFLDVPTIAMKVERWLLDGGPGRVTTLGAPRKSDGEPDWRYRLAFLSGKDGADPRLELIERSRLSEPDDSLDVGFRTALAAYGIGDRP